MSPLLAEIDWNEFVQSGDFPVIVFVAIAGLVAITAIIAVQWRKTQELRLKEKMVERGFTADEIARVVGARSGNKPKLESGSPCCPETGC
jgi:hypothetical protein